MTSKNNQKIVTRSYTWDLRNFAYIVKFTKPGDKINCPLFCPLNWGKAWKFEVYPKGKSCEDYISFDFYRLHPSRQTYYNCTLSIGRPDTTPVRSYKYLGKQFMDNVIGEDKFLMMESNNWFSRGMVRFRCDIEKIGSKNHEEYLPDITNLSLDLKELFMYPLNSDLTIIACGNEIYIHKYILFARCPFFCYGFGYNTFEELPSSIEIEVNDKIFEDLVHFIYTGKLRDSDVSVELVRYAEHFNVYSLIQCMHEENQSFHFYSEPVVDKHDISWNLNELNYWQKGSTCVHVLRTKLYAEKLAIGVCVKNDCENENSLYVSFRFLRIDQDRTVTLESKLSITSQAGLEAFKEEHHIFLEDEEWSFPRLLYKKDKDNLCLTAELSMSEASNLVQLKSVKTTNKLYTDYQTVIENLLYLPNGLAHLNNPKCSFSNLILLSSDNKPFQVHDGIMWARWPGVGRLIERSSVSSDEENEVVDQLELKLPSEVLNILLEYFYTGYISQFDKKKAEVLLQYSNYLQYPNHLVKKCIAVMRRENQAV